MRKIPVGVLFLAVAALPASAQAPKPERSIVGVWVLKSATVNGKTATNKDLAGLLKDFGGCELGMIYKFRKSGSEGTVSCSLNDRELSYRLIPETKELAVETEDDEGYHGQMFGLKFIDKNMQLRFKEKDKVVLMLFTPDD